MLTEIRLNPTYVRRQRRLEELLREVPLVGTPAEKAVDAMKAAVREVLQPPAFFEALGVRYVGPVDGHDIPALEQAMRNAVELSTEGPIVVHVVTQKGRGYPPAEDDDEKHLHDAPVFDPLTGPPKAVPTGYTQAFAEAIIKEAEADDRIVAITAAMAGPTGLLPFQDRFPDRFFDVGIAEQHAVTAAAGHGDGRLAPDRRDLLDVPQPGVGPGRLRRRPAPPAGRVLHRPRRASPVPTDRATTACTTWRCSPGCRACGCSRPSSAQELQQMLHDAMRLADGGPVAIRYPRGQARNVGEHEVGVGIRARRTRAAEGDPADGACACSPSAGSSRRPRRLPTCSTAGGVPTTVWDVRCCAPLDADMLADAARHRVVVTCEDGVRDGGIGMAIEDRIGDLDPATPVEVLGLPTRFLAHEARPERLLAQLGLDADGIAAAARRLLHDQHRRRRSPARSSTSRRSPRTAPRPRRSPTRRRSPGAPRSSATCGSGSPSTTTWRPSPARRRPC